MAKWVDANTISSFEDHRNDWLCDKWLAPIDDGIKIKWDKSYYSPYGTGILKVIDNEMNLDNTILDVFEVHVWSDIDHNGIQLTVTETDKDTGIFTGKVSFTTDNESSGARLLVEDAVHAEHKENYNFSRIINEAIPEYTAEEIDEELVLTPVQTKTIGDDAPFFGIFVYLDNLISWILGK